VELIVVNIPLNHRMFEVGSDVWKSFNSTPDQYSRLHRTMSSQDHALPPKAETPQSLWLICSSV